MSHKEYSRFLDQNRAEPKSFNLKKYLPTRVAFYSREITLGQKYEGRHVKNIVNNQKYSVFTFLPLVLFEQFKFFLNAFFLLIAISQFFGALRISDPYTYWGPLGFVLSVTVIREAYEDFFRFWRDRQLNSQEYQKFGVHGSTLIKSKDIRVGDVLVLHKNQRIPADVILLRTSEPSGTCFIKTDQLDGETDWKLKHAIPILQALNNDDEIYHINCKVFAESPHKNIYAFVGTCTRVDLSNDKLEWPLTVDNVLWASTTLTAGSALVLVIYSGRETRAELNRSNPHYKVGLLDKEVDRLTMALCSFLLLLTFGSLAMRRPQTPDVSIKEMIRFLILYSYILPISLKVTMEVSKLFHSFRIRWDKAMPNIQVRTSSIPEELGRISYLLTDKTGTLTKNEMKFKKLHVGSASLSEESFDDIARAIKKRFTQLSPIESKVLIAVESIALCHNVTPLMENGKKMFQASSPDEVALLEWADQVGISLTLRTTSQMALTFKQLPEQQYKILSIFPFTSERKRMGIIVQNVATGEIAFHVKGADTVIAPMIGYSHWLEEECNNMAREGLRTMVFAKRIMEPKEHEQFQRLLHDAKMSTSDRSQKVEAAISTIEKNLTLLSVTGVEDQLQTNVRASIESLVQAGIKVCMLTGDKHETAVSIARSCGLIKKMSAIMLLNQVATKEDVFDELERIKEKIVTSSVLLVNGTMFEQCCQFEARLFTEVFDLCETTVIFRCSPDQKARLATLLKKVHPKARVAAVGDGGNDVTMIQEAHVGIGIESKEGKQASLASDFAISEFSSICTLLMVHGRNAYKQTSVLAQFVMHRGIITAVLQALFCFLHGFPTIQVFDNFLMMNFTTIYTPLAIFSILTDHDTSRAASLTYSELYKELRRGRCLTLKTFSIWLLISVYQAAVLYYGFHFFGDGERSHFVTVVFSALVLNELLMVLVVVQRLTIAMIIGELQCLLALIVSLIFLPFFDQHYMTSSWRFWVLTSGLTTLAVGPFFVLKFIRRRFAPSNATKVK